MGMTDFYWILLFMFIISCIPAIFMGKGREKLFWPGVGLIICTEISWVGYFTRLVVNAWEWSTPLILFVYVPTLIMSILFILVGGMGISAYLAGFSMGADKDANL